MICKFCNKDIPNLADFVVGPGQTDFACMECMHKLTLAAIEKHEVVVEKKNDR